MKVVEKRTASFVDHLSGSDRLPIFVLEGIESFLVGKFVEEVSSVFTVSPVAPWLVGSLASSNGES